MCYLKPYTRDWFVAAIIAEFESRDFYLSDDPVANAARQWNDAAQVECFGKIGRLVENYRWRFLLGSDVIRGKRTKESAAAGGRAKAAERASRSRHILITMAEHIKSGHSVSRAAELAVDRGIGSSAEANRKLWSRKRKLPS